MVVGIFVLVAGAWWLTIGLSAEEQALIGTWRCDTGGKCEFAPDRRASIVIYYGGGMFSAVEHTGAWSVHGVMLVLDGNESEPRRLAFRLEWLGPDRIAITRSKGIREVYTRAHAD